MVCERDGIRKHSLCSGEDAFLPPLPTKFDFGFNTMCFLMSWLVFFSATRGFTLDTTVFPSLEKTNFDLICY